MDTVKASISVGEASIQLEGPQEFVEKYLEQYYPLIQGLHELAQSRAGATTTTEVASKEVVPAKRQRAKGKTAGPSCADRIRALIDEDYFKEPRNSGEIGTWLKDQKTTPYADNQVTAALPGIVKSGKLRRYKEDGAYKYINP